MTKVYVKFGEPLADEDHIYVYEGLLEDNIVKILLPTASYSMCQTLAKDIEQQGFIVEGTHIGQANNGLLALKDYEIIHKLHYNAYVERYEVKEKELPIITVEPQTQMTRAELRSKLPPVLRLFVTVGDMVLGNNKDKSGLQTFTKK